MCDVLYGLYFPFSEATPTREVNGLDQYELIIKSTFMSRTNTHRKCPLEEEIDSWNKAIKIGDKIEYYSHSYAIPEILTTRTEAQVLGGHTAVVWLNGKAACVSSSTCRPLTIIMY
jgi:hypothetical protein